MRPERLDLASTLDGMKRRRIRQRDELEARESAESRRVGLLAQMRAREAAAREPADAEAPAIAMEPEPIDSHQRRHRMVDKTPKRPPKKKQPKKPKG